MTTSTNFIPSESALELLCGTAPPRSRGPALMRSLKKAGRVAAGSAVLAGGMVSALYSVLETNPVIFLATELSSFAAIVAGYAIMDRTIMGNTLGQETPEKDFYYGAHREGEYHHTPGFTRVGPHKEEQADHCLERVYPVSAEQLMDAPEAYSGKLIFLNNAEFDCCPAEVNVIGPWDSVREEYATKKTPIATSVCAYLFPSGTLTVDLAVPEHAYTIAQACSPGQREPHHIWIMGRLNDGLSRYRPSVDEPASGVVFAQRLTLYAYGAAFETRKTFRPSNYNTAPSHSGSSDHDTAEMLQPDIRGTLQDGGLPQ